MIFPRRWSTILRPSSRASTNGAVRLTSSTRSQMSSPCSTAARRSIVPAFRTSTSRRCKSEATAAASACTAWRSSKSQRYARNSRPRDLTLWATSSSVDSEALTPAMSAPARAKATAAARPMPRRHPVTNAVLPDRSKLMRGSQPGSSPQGGRSSLPRKAMAAAPAARRG